MSRTKVKENIAALADYNRSMQVAIQKAERGSDTEDMYFIEKLEKTANCLGYALLAKKH